MSEEPTGLFSSLAQPDSRLIRSSKTPDMSDLKPGDMVIIPDEWGNADFVDQAAEHGVHVATGWYRFEEEQVGPRAAPKRSTPGAKAPAKTLRGVQRDYTSALSGANRHGTPSPTIAASAVEHSTTAFAQTWDALAVPRESNPVYEDASKYLPDAWVPLLPFPTLNPAQVQAVGKLTGADPLMVVAPTGAGKTAMGMIAALREIKERGGRAAWLVPQRSLTAELDRELQTWRDAGLKVVALSGEVATDIQATREADLWVATTEKFEALCRAASMRETVSQIGTLVVDEIHLLGEPSRGPLLENLLARIKGVDSRVRLVGLSATASNAHDVAKWLEADLVEIAWRPTRLSQQVLTVPDGDRQSESRYRNSVATRITREVSGDGGSTLVFCGAKANVRSTALAIAHSRGVETALIDASDVEAVAEACTSAGVGLHYADWPYKRQAERDFRERKINVLVATSTLAAGVNTPARVVVVRDTSIGPNPMEVSMVQQMFGRAGRAGKEPEGWAFLVCTLSEVDDWRGRLAAGYSIQSGIQDSVADHLLGEIVQGHVTTLREAEQWWVSTLAHYQGAGSDAVVTRARDFLQNWRFIEVEEIADADQRLTATDLGKVTSKMMVDVNDAASLMSQLGTQQTPASAQVAEDRLIEVMSTTVGALSSGSSAPAEQYRAVSQIIVAGGDRSRMGTMRAPASSGRNTRVTASTLSQAGMLLAARSPQVLTSSARQVLGVTRALFNPAIYDSPRYFAWLSAVGPYQAVPAWVSVVALDLGRRIAWHRAHPRRGHGRVLLTCERLVGAKDPHTNVPKLFISLVEQGVSCPENWMQRAHTNALGISATACQQATGNAISLDAGNGSVTTSARTVLSYDGNSQGAPRWSRVPLSKGHGRASGIVVAFGASGDCRGSEWLQEFAIAAQH